MILGRPIVLVLTTLLAAAASALTAVAAQEVRDSSGAALVGLDHVVVAVNDLDEAAALYRQIGFTLKLGRYHENGIRNQHAKFPDGTEIELLTVAEARDALTAEYLDHLGRGDGPAEGF